MVAEATSVKSVSVSLEGSATVLAGAIFSASGCLSCGFCALHDWAVNASITSAILNSLFMGWIVFEYT